jgi:hypothetical protein
METRPSPWIVNPVFDLLFVCGGLPVLMIALNVWFWGWNPPFAAQSMAERWFLVVLLLGQHIFADAHNAATHLRIWGSEEDRRRFAFYRTWLTFSCLPLFLFGLLYPPATSVFVYLYLIAVYWHYAAQAFGISLIYCAKRGYMMTTGERKIYRGFFLSLAALVIVRFLTFRQLSPSVWFGVPIPFWGPLPLPVYRLSQLCFAIYALGFAAIIAKKLLRERKVYPLPSAMIVTTILGLGLILGPANGLLWLYVPAFFHGSQYLAVCLTYFLKERGVPEQRAFQQMGRLLFSAPAVKFFALAVASGCLFYVAVPYSLSRLGFDFALVAGLVLAIINYHHFITDAAIWRLRDPRYRKLLLT